MNEKLVFNAAMEGLIGATQMDLTPRVKARMKALGFDADAKVLPAYPAELWASVVKALGEELYPGVAPDDAHRKLAIRTVEMYAKGMIGAAMFAVAGVLGPDRTVRRMTRNFRTGSNFIETTCEEVAPHTYDIGFNDVSGVPGFYAGCLEGGFIRVGARGLSVKIYGQTIPGAVYRVNWSA